jgi:hypothetical protein
MKKRYVNYPTGNSTWFIPITQSDQEGSSSLSKYVNILNRQLATLKSLEGEIAQLSVD